MHPINKCFLPFIFVMLALIAASAQAQPMEEANKTLSPYFFVKSDDPGVDHLPLKSTSADVKVVGVIIVITLADLKILSKAPPSPGGAFEPLIDFGLF